MLGKNLKDMSINIRIHGGELLRERSISTLVDQGVLEGNNGSKL